MRDFDKAIATCIDTLVTRHGYIDLTSTVNTAIDGKLTGRDEPFKYTLLLISPYGDLLSIPHFFSESENVLNELKNELCVSSKIWQQKTQEERNKECQ